MAGTDLTMRKIATPARMTMMSDAAPVLSPRKMESAGRDLTRPALTLLGAPGRDALLLILLAWT